MSHESGQEPGGFEFPDSGSVKREKMMLFINMDCGSMQEYY